MLAQAVAVEGSGVEVAHAERQGLLERLPGFRLGDHAEHVAERGASEAELRDLDCARAEAPEDPVSFGPIPAISFRRHRRFDLRWQWRRGDHAL